MYKKGRNCSDFPKKLGIYVYNNKWVNALLKIYKPLSKTF